MEVLCNVLSILRCHLCGELDLLLMEDKINRNCGWKCSFYLEALSFPDELFMA